MTQSLAPVRVFCVRYSGDAMYVMSGSDDTNVRLWKAQASEQLGVVSLDRRSVCGRTADNWIVFLGNVKTVKRNSNDWHDWDGFWQLIPRERQKQAYLNAVKERYAHLPEMRRIERWGILSWILWRMSFNTIHSVFARIHVEKLSCLES